MHPSRSFAWNDRDEMLAFVAEMAFATIFVAGPHGNHVVHVPVVSHGPGALRFHVARTNAATNGMDGAQALLSSTGCDAYISPDWYETPNQVPTWNYVAVEVEGQLKRLNDEELVTQLDALSAVHEARLAPKRPWTRAKMQPGSFEAMTRGIVGFELGIDAVRGTRKLSQNKQPADREGVLAALRAGGQSDMACLIAEAARK